MRADFVIDVNTHVSVRVVALHRFRRRVVLEVDSDPANLVTLRAGDTLDVRAAVRRTLNTPTR